MNEGVQTCCHGMSHENTWVYYREVCTNHCGHASMQECHEDNYTTVGCELMCAHLQVLLGLSAPFSVHMHVRVCAWACTCAYTTRVGGLCPLHSSPSPLPSPEVASRAAAQEATGGVGTAVATGSPPRCTLIHILAATQGLVKDKARGTDAVEATECIVAGGTAAGRRQQGTFILV